MNIFNVEKDTLEFNCENKKGPYIEFNCLLFNESDSIIVLDLQETTFEIFYNYEKKRYVCEADYVFKKDTLCDFLDNKLIFLFSRESTSNIKFGMYLFENNPWLNKENYLKTLLRILPTVQVFLLAKKMKVKSIEVINVNIN